MPKRKTSNDKPIKGKKSKEDEVLINKGEDEKSSEKEKQEVNPSETKPDDHVKKLEDFKSKFGMSKGNENDLKCWISSESYLIYNPSDLEASEKIAAFDVDSTLIVTKTGKKFPKTWDDFKIMFDKIPAKLKSLKSKGYKIVIFTNQGGFSNGHVKENDFKKKMKVLLEKLGVSIQIFIAIDKSVTYRKPNIGLFELLQNTYNNGVKIDLNNSFYVGDAAGRPDNWEPKKKKDFSCSDRLFALNCGLAFHTPEEFFLDQPLATFSLPSFNPTAATDSSLSIKSLTEDGQSSLSLADLLPSDQSELVLIVMVGSPGSGKSHFCRKHLEPAGFTVINRDTLKTWQKCVAETERLLKEGKRVVIDNTNPDRVSRERYVQSALKAGLKHVLCFVLDVDYDQCRHNGKFREMTDADHEPVSEMVFRMHSSKYQAPVADEKFTSIVSVRPGMAFEEAREAVLYRRYLNDK